MATAILERPVKSAKILTYGDYLSEGEIGQPYEIIDGERIFMAGPAWAHQRIVLRLVMLLEMWGQQIGGYALPTPFDLIIWRDPLRVRQPDILFISKARLNENGGIPQSGGLEIAPEIVVEVLSDSDTPAVLFAKLADYRAIGVEECWLVRPQNKTVEVMSLVAAGSTSVAVYTNGATVFSDRFPDLQIAVADIFTL